MMRKPLLIVGGLIVALIGAVFSLQGFGVFKGSSMTNSTFWAVAGPIIVVIGLAGAWRGVR